MERKLDRIPQFDERSRAFRAVDVITQKSFRSYTWPCNTFLDQGSEGACVGFSISHELAAIPVAYPATEETALQIYRRARQLDPWPGEDYDGTSVLAGIKACQEGILATDGLPVFREYRWAFGLEDLVRVLGRKGPCVLGINWYTGMFNTDESGYIHVTGGIAGGHAILARGVKVAYVAKGNRSDWNNVDKEKSYVVLHNSWGPDWGKNGTAKISFLDLDRLLNEQGEAVLPISRVK